MNAKVYQQRWDFILPYIQGKNVLDIGPAELVGTVNQEKIDRWLHGKIALEAASLVGVEQNIQQINVLNALGYDIREGDAENFSLSERFDIIVAGELIEHLSNPGCFLENVRKHLVPGGKLILTTPNRFSIIAIYKILRTGKVPVYQKPIAKHVLYFDSDSLRSLLERHGFSKIGIDYCAWVDYPKSGWIGWIVKLTSYFRPVMLSTLLAVAEFDG